MKYRVRQNLNNDFVPELKWDHWPFWFTFKKYYYMDSYDVMIFSSLAEALEEIKNHKKNTELTRKSKIWKVIWP